MHNTTKENKSDLGANEEDCNIKTEESYNSAVKIAVIENNLINAQ